GGSAECLLPSGQCKGADRDCEEREGCGAQKASRREAVDHGVQGSDRLPDGTLEVRWVMQGPVNARKILGLMMIAFGLFALLVHPGWAAAQNTAASPDLPQVENAKVQTQGVSGSLETTIAEISGRSEKPIWIAYGVDAIPGRHSACCGNYTDDDDGR